MSVQQMQWLELIFKLELGLVIDRERQSIRKQSFDTDAKHEAF